MISLVIPALSVLAIVGVFWLIRPHGWDAYDKRIGHDIDAGSEHRARHPKTGRPRD